MENTGRGKEKEEEREKEKKKRREEEKTGRKEDDENKLLKVVEAIGVVCDRTNVAIK